MTGRLLTARQVADLLGVHVKTTLAWVQRGELPAIRLPGGAIRVRESDLDAWLEARTTAAPAPGGGHTHEGNLHDRPRNPAGAA